MEIFSLKNLSFTYNASDSPVLKDINLEIKKGEFLLLIGQSGCGKTTLLKMLKKELTPFGKSEGEIFFKRKKITDYNSMETASKIGFIMQDVESQIVTDKVYSELAFGLENLGYDKETIRARVAEFANFFGLSYMFERKTDSLSGGEKQLLNLASVMVMNPEVIILDEPVSMLDPIFAEKFINSLKKINDEFGTTIIIAEHHLLDVFKFADRVALLEDGKLTAVNSINEIYQSVRGKEIEKTLPVPVRIFNCFNLDGECPVTVKDAISFLNKNNIKSNYNSLKEIYRKEVILSAKNLWFRYQKNSRDILKNFSVNVKKGEIYAVLGENGSGKSTLLNLLNGSLKPYRGKIKCASKVAYLPQNPKNVFVKDNLEEDLKSINNSYLELLERFGLEKYVNTHPYDLSGGELQRAALIKVLLTKPDIILLDEPTKGLDSFSKKELGGFLKNLTENGLTIILVTHDLEFAAEFSNRCGLLFDGEITSERGAKSFFMNNIFFTTPAAKISCATGGSAVTADELISELKEEK